MIFLINENHKRWAKNAKRKYKKPISFWLDIISKQEGKCALTHAELKFDSINGTSKLGAHGCHPLYAAVDHIYPSSSDGGYQILCYDINDLKGHIPFPLFEALKKTKEWKNFTQKWKQTADLYPESRDIFKALIKAGE